MCVCVCVGVAHSPVRLFSLPFLSLAEETIDSWICLWMCLVSIITITTARLSTGHSRLKVLVNLLDYMSVKASWQANGLGLLILIDSSKKSCHISR